MLKIALPASGGIRGPAWRHETGADGALGARRGPAQHLGQNPAKIGDPPIGMAVEDPLHVDRDMQGMGPDRCVQAGRHSATRTASSGSQFRLTAVPLGRIGWPSFWRKTLTICPPQWMR